MQHFAAGFRLLCAEMPSLTLALPPRLSTLVRPVALLNPRVLEVQYESWCRIWRPSQRIAEFCSCRGIRRCSNRRAARSRIHQHTQLLAGHATGDPKKPSGWMPIALPGPALPCWNLTYGDGAMEAEGAAPGAGPGS